MPIEEPISPAKRVPPIHDHTGSGDHDHQGSGDHDHGHDHQGSGDHDHDHDHVPKVSKSNEKIVLLAFFITFTFMLVEAIGGYLSGSLALIADAGHMLTDAAALALSWAAFHFGARAADGRRTFGYLRFEVLAGFINALTLFGIAGWVIFEAVKRFRQPVEILAGPMLVVAVIGLLVNVLVLWLLQRGDTSHVNIRGASLHVLGDLLGSVGAIAAAGVIWFTGWAPIDPILSVIVCLLILRSAWSLLNRSLHILLEGAPDNASPELLERHLMSKIPTVRRVRHVHVWEITSGKALATMHVLPAPGADLRGLVSAIETELKSQFNISHVTVAIDWDDISADDCIFTSATRTGEVSP